MVSFDLLEVYVGYVVIGVVVAGLGACLGAGVGSGLLGLCLGVEDVLLGSAECGLDFLDGGVDAGEVLGLVGVFQFLEGAFDGGFLVGGNLVAELAELLFGAEDHGIGVVELVDALFLLGVGGGVGLCFVLHALDFSVGQA